MRHQLIDLLQALHFQFSLYGSLACLFMLRAWHDHRERHHDEARENWTACLVHWVIAILHVGS
jgi:hypothetical protein